MLFIEPRFFLFFLIIFSVYWAITSHTARRVWLLFCSYFFYAAFFVGDDPFGPAPLPAGWWFPFLLAGSTCMDYIVGVRLEDSKTARAKKWWVVVSVIINIGVLVCFKYMNFFIQSASAFTAWIGLPVSLHTLKIILPYGISFYTFQSMSYTLEVYRGHRPAERSFLSLAAFVSFFPQLVAGPIVRAMSFLPQLESKRRWADVDVRGALVLFMCGFVKKACISDSVAPFVDQYFAAPSAYTGLSAVIAVLLYAVQIYCDFSGYTDMAIACARLLGHELTLNFSFPYFSRSVTEFWKRWHISLSTWLRDYLYISLGGNRGSKLFTYRNLFLTMLLGGLWHGSRWTFMAWGILHGLALILHREWAKGFLPRFLPFLQPRPAGLVNGAEAGNVVKIPTIKSPGESVAQAVAAAETTESNAHRGGGGSLATASRPARWLAAAWPAVATLLTFWFVCCCWIFFRAADLKAPLSMDDFHRAMLVLKNFHGLGNPWMGHSLKALDPKLLLLFAGLALVHWCNFKGVFSTWWRKCPEPVFALAYGALTSVILLFIPAHYAPFIYFQF